MSDLVSKFWDLYQEDGIEPAVAYAQELSGGNLEALKAEIPDLLAQANERGIEIIPFLEQLEAAETANADGTDNDGDIVHSDGSADADAPQDADQPAEPSSDDGQAGDGAETTEGSEG